MAVAQQWFEEFEGAAGLDGIIAKPLTITYQPDKRVMFKIKHERTADCVVAGYRVHKSGSDAIGSLLLGLYKDDGTLASVGVIGAFPMAKRRQLLHRVAAARHELRWPPVELGSPRSRWTHPAPKRRLTLERRQGSVVRRRCDPSGWSRFAMTTWKANGSATPLNSIAGAPTVTHVHAPTRSSNSVPLLPSDVVDSQAVTHVRAAPKLTETCAGIRQFSNQRPHAKIPGMHR